MLRYKRLVSCLLSFSLLVCFAGSFLAVKVSAAAENLVPTDMRQWETLNAVGSSSITYYAGGQGNEITFTPQNNIYFVGLVEGIDYVAGHTYNLSFGSTYNEVNHLTWGFGYRTSDDTFQFLSESNSITSENKMSFVAPDTVNSIYVVFVFDGTNTQHVQINHLLCVDVTASEQQAVIDNQNQNAQDIKDNADKNAQEIKDNADENTTKIGGWLSELGDKIKSIFYIDTFLAPEWVHKYVNSSGNLANNSRAACTSDMFEVSGSCSVSHTFPVYLYVIKYTSNGVFVSRTGLLRNNVLELDPGYSYRLSVDDYVTIANYAEGDPLDDYMNSMVLIESSISVFQKLFQDIINGLKSLFVPSDGFFDDFTEDMNVVLEERFGVLFQIGDFLDDVLTSVKDLIQSSGSSDFTFTLPAMSFTFLGYNISLWDDITIEFTEIFTNMSWFSILYVAYSVTVQIFLIAILFSYGDKLFKEVFRS